MFKFNYNVFKSNCNALSKQFNQVRSTCVVYHDLCQESVIPSVDSTAKCSTKIQDDENELCPSHNCSNGHHKLQPNHDVKSTHLHLHHHNHEHGLVYSKRVRSILLLNALFSSNVSSSSNAASNSSLGQTGRVSPTSLSNNSSLSCSWNNCAEQIRHYSKKVGKDKKSSKGKGNKSSLKVQLTDDEINSVIDSEELRVTFDHLIDNFRKDLVANINLKVGKNIDEMPIKMDNQTFQLRELAQISRKNANLICLNLNACPDALKPTLQAIQDSGICINPQQEGTSIYLPLPKVTKEHRENLLKSAKSLLNSVKNDLKNIQNNFIKEARNQKQAKISEDLIFNVCENIKHLTEEAANQCEHLYEEKCKQLMQ